MKTRFFYSILTLIILMAAGCSKDDVTCKCTIEKYEVSEGKQKQIYKEEFLSDCPPEAGGGIAKDVWQLGNVITIQECDKL